MQNQAASQVLHTIVEVESQRAVWIAGGDCVRHEIFGEEHNQQQMQLIAASLNGRADVPLPAWLAPEPAGVTVWARGSRVGYLAPPLAAAWHPILTSLSARYGVPIACQATLDPPTVANQGVLGLVVWLPTVMFAKQSVEGPGSARHRAHPGGAPEYQTKESRELEALRAQLATTEQELEAAARVANHAIRPADATAAQQAEFLRLSTEIEARQAELRAVEESLEIQSFGFYTPKYGFESSAQYTSRLKGTRDEQQRLIKADQAAPCDTKWTVGGSASEGKKMVKQQAKLMLRAFNGECDAAVAKVRYDNVVTMERRVEKAYADINKLGEVQRVFISRRYLDLKLAELHLVHEHREKVEEEKEEQRRIRDQMREEQKAQAEIERAKVEAEKEEAISAAALEKARAQLAAEQTTSKQHEKLEQLVNRLETELKDALDRKAKAIARAQLTRSGHVYVLSNLGSFGDGVFKIGLTRRLDPFERVDELGDASVPFPFDVHAVIFAEDAPALETKLHQAFAARRINLVNRRKEYFRVTLQEIREEVAKHHGLVSFALVAEAEEYRKSLSARDAGVVPELLPAPADHEANA